MMRIKIVVSGIVLTISLSGCLFGFLEKNDNASLANSAHQRLSSKLDQSNLVRASGRALYIRLSQLFPYAVGGNNDLGALNEKQFQMETATGFNRSLAQNERPTSALAVSALRSIVTNRCHLAVMSSAESEYNSNPRAGSIFSDHILFQGETFPIDPVDALAFRVARNVWLEPYAATSNEVKVLASLYRDTYRQFLSANASGGSAEAVRQAKLSVCIAALIAPQFALGSPGPRDAFKRVAVEIGSRIPTFAELEQATQGTLTLVQYVQRIQHETGYLKSVNNWHQDWLGFRNFLGSWSPDENGVDHVTADPRGVGISYIADEDGLVSLAGGDSRDSFRQHCVPRNAEGALNLQTFDPRTSMILYEMRNFQTSRWEVLGAFVEESRLPAYKAKIEEQRSASSVPASFNQATDCVKITSTGMVPTFGSASTPYGDFNKQIAIDAVPQFNGNRAQPVYYRCQGRVSRLDGSGFIASNIQDAEYMSTPAASTHLNGRNLKDYGQADGGWSRAVSELAPYAARSSEMTAANGQDAWFYYPDEPLFHSVMVAHIKSSDTRYRRFSPPLSANSDVDQSGLSRVYAWYTHEAKYVCNNVHRHIFTCNYRFNEGASSTGTFTHTAENGGATPGVGVRSSLYDRVNHQGFAHPLVLNQMRCGVPNPAELNSTAAIQSTQANLRDNDTVLHPFGYNYSDQTVGALNEVIWWVKAARETGNEGLAISRLRNDIHYEPYQLIKKVLTENRSYQEVFSANYTVGHSELDLMYRTHGMILPLYPPRAHPTAFANGPSSTLNFSDYEPYSENFISEQHGYVLGALNLQYATRMFPVRPAAGILSMPAYLNPVLREGTLRTLAQRYFIRALCQDPNVFHPAAQTPIHEKYMSDSEDNRSVEIRTSFNWFNANRPFDINLASKNHLNSKSSCYECHVNIDPLGSALSTTFLPFVQKSEFTAARGSMDVSNTELFGVSFVGSKSKGAFLGSEVEGIEGVSRKLIQSDEWASCAVETAFLNVYGRRVVASDGPEFRRIVKKFKTQNFNYNLMIQELVSSPGYRKDN